MQNQALIPSPLHPAGYVRKPIEIVEPARPSWFRFVRVFLFFIGLFLKRLAPSRWLLPAKSQAHSEENARYVRAFLEKMGGLWIKAGQILALRRDLFSEEFCAQLSRLQDRAQGFPGSYSRRIIEQELGKPLAEIFIEFDEAPLAAASIGQTHRALLRGDNQEVVIKVQRPNIVAIFSRDLRVVRWLTQLLERLRIAPHFRWGDMYLEIERAILDELDYRMEAAAIKRMRKNLRSHRIYVPKPYLDLCSDRILVMEMVHGVYMSEYILVAANDPQKAQQWLEENQISARRAGERLLFSHYRQLLEDNLYHCDLHPGNILLMRGSRITLIDFGSVGSLDRSQLQKLLHLWRAIGSRDYEKAAEIFLLICPWLPERDLTEVKQQIDRFYREFESLSKIKSLPYHQKSIGRVIGQITEVLQGIGVPAPLELLRSNRAQLTLDASLMFLLPNINYPKTLRRYLTAMRGRQENQMRSAARIRGQLAKLSESMDLPAKAAETAYFQGEYLRLRAFKYEGYLSQAASLGGKLFRAISSLFLLIGLGAGAIFVQQRFGALSWLRASWVHGPLRLIPKGEPGVFLLSALAALYVRHELSAIGQMLQEPKPARIRGEPR